MISDLYYFPGKYKIYKKAGAMISGYHCYGLGQISPNKTIEELAKMFLKNTGIVSCRRTGRAVGTPTI
jgi:hypothetical protein